LKSTGAARPANPFYWSAFIMIGSNEPLFHKNDKWLVVAACVLAFFLTFSIFRSRAKISQNKSVPSFRLTKTDQN
jgi:hypothetical protein